MIESVARDGLCTGCGTCVGVCPRHAVEMVIDYHNGIFVPQVDVAECNDCGLCYEVCPGIAVDFRNFNLALFGKELDDIVLGGYLNCFTGHSTDYDVRYNSTSGGLVTTLLVHALEERFIDGALVTRMRNDRPFEPEPFIARTKEDLVTACRSKYCPVPANTVLKEVLMAKEDERFAVVGLPCHIHGIRKAAAVNSALAGKIVMYLGLLCSHSDSFKMTQFILRWHSISTEQVVGISYRGEGWPGAMAIELKGGGRELIPFVEYGVIHNLDLFTPTRCLLCCDGLNKWADLSFGDLWLRGNPGTLDDVGTSVVICRSSRGEEFLWHALCKGKLELTGMSDGMLEQWIPTLFRIKRARAAVPLRRIFGKKAPLYNIDFPSPRLVDHLTIVLGYLAGWIGSRQFFWGITAKALPMAKLAVAAMRRVAYRVFGT